MKTKFVIDGLNYSTLNNIDCTISKPSIISLIGKSNSELDLFFKCIADIYDYKGTILLNDNNIKNLKKVSLCIGIVNLSEKSVLDNLIEPLLNIGNSDTEAKKKAYDIVKELDISNLLYKNINDLSYSQKKIVSFAKSIVTKPSILLLSYIFTSIDEYYKNKIFKCLIELRDKNDSIIIFTTNNADELLIADSIMVLIDGKIVLFDETKKVFNENETLLNNGKLLVPFIVDLSYKLKSYNLINKVMYDSEKMVNELWK